MMRKRINKQGAQSGLTLIEVVVSMVVLLSFTMAISSLITMAFHSTRVLYHQVLADQAISTVIDDIRYDQQGPPKADSGSTTIDGITFAWDVKVVGSSEVTIASYMKQVTVHCSWTDDFGSHEMTRRSNVAYPEVADPPPSLGGGATRSVAGSNGRIRRGRPMCLPGTNAFPGANTQVRLYSSGKDKGEEYETQKK